MPSWFDDLVAFRKEEVIRAKRDLPLARIQQRISGWPPPRDFAGSVRQGSGIIALFKRASPYQGSLRERADGAAFARSVEQGGASAIAVVTEQSFFKGSLDDLERIRRSAALPILRLDLHWEEYQIFESRLWGADAVWLIAGLLTPSRLKALLGAARSLTLSVPVEVHDRKETAKALKAGADILALNLREKGAAGLNKRKARELGPAIPRGTLKLIAGGIKAREEIEEYRKAGFAGFIVGEHLMLSKSPGEALRKLWSE